MRILLIFLLVFLTPLQAAQPATLTPGASPEALQGALAAAIKSGVKKFVIPPGEYRVPKFTGKWFLTIKDTQDFEIEAANVTLILEGPGNGFFDFSGCKRVTLRGITLRHETPPFAQMKIEAIAADELSFDVRMSKGFPQNFDDPECFSETPTGYVFDPTTRQWKSGCLDLIAKKVEQLGPGLYKLHWSRKSGTSMHPVAVGDFMAFRGRGLTDVYLGGCESMRLENVTIQSGGGFCFHENGGMGGNIYNGLKVTYAPVPKDAEMPPLVACNADAFHSSGTRHGPTLERCSFEGMPDDGIAIHGSFQLVRAIEGAKLIVAQKHGGRPAYQVGDRVCVLNKEGAPLGESRVKSINQRKEFTPPDTSFHAFKESRNFFELELDPPVPGTAVDSFTCNLDTLGNGYVLRGNTIRNHRARGMLLKAENGLVENNLIDGSTISGIVLNPEIWWAEAGYSRRVTVRGNTIRHCGYAMTGTWTTQAGALTVYAAGPGLDAIGHDQLVIENNIFENNTGVNMLLDGLKNSRVNGNRFKHSQQQATKRGAQYVDTGALIFIGRCDGLKLENNHTTKPGAAGTILLKCSPQAKNVEGAENGIKVDP